MKKWGDAGGERMGVLPGLPRAHYRVPKLCGETR